MIVCQVSLPRLHLILSTQTKSAAQVGGCAPDLLAALDEDRSLPGDRSSDQKGGCDFQVPIVLKRDSRFNPIPLRQRAI